MKKGAMTNNEEKLRGKRKVQSGTVISNKAAKMLVVKVERKFRHPIYEKVVTSSKKYYAHDEEAHTVNVGDKVTIVECRPMSKLKRWRVVREG